MKKKTIALLLVMMMVFGITVGGTIAYLTDTDEVVNTFTVGNVTISMVETKVDAYGVAVNADDLTKAAFDKKVTDGEIAADAEWVAATTTGNEYKLIPGHTYTKDPTITVDPTSENCWLFAKIENGLGKAATIQVNDGWEPVAGEEGVYYYSTLASANTEVTVFESFTVAGDANVENYVTEKNEDGTVKDGAVVIKVTAYAVQKDGFDTAQEAWDATFGA